LDQFKVGWKICVVLYSSPLLMRPSILQWKKGPFLRGTI
jgi:hypothetical protein